MFSFGETEGIKFRLGLHGHLSTQYVARTSSLQLPYLQQNTNILLQHETAGLRFSPETAENDSKLPEEYLASQRRQRACCYRGGSCDVVGTKWYQEHGARR